jgi:hypothetical protein
MTQEHWSSPTGCHPDCPACEAKDERKDEERQAYIDAARSMYGDDDIEIDDDAELSEVTEGEIKGAWVQAWVWVSEGEK